VREIDFVPTWYVAVHKRRRLFKLQLWLTVVVILSLGTWIMVDAQRHDSSRDLLSVLQSRLALSEGRLRERATQQQLREQLQTQQRIEASLGLNVEASRVLSMLERVIPKVCTLNDIEIDTVETARQIVGAARSAPIAAGAKAPVAQVDRRLRVQVRGVAPANADVAGILEGLSTTGVCEELKLNYTRETTKDGFVLRAFEIEFIVRLNTAGGAL